MSAKLSWTPRGEATAQNVLVNWGGISRQTLSYPTQKATQVSTGGTAVSVHADSWIQGVLETNPISRPSNSVAWQKISSFISHVQAGGQFAYYYDENNDLDTTLSSGVAKGATSLTLASTTNLTAGDYVYIEDVDDATKWEVRGVDTVAAPIVLENGVSYGFGASSIVRHAEYFPTCIALDWTWEERRAGQGAYVWDFGFTFRTVR